MPGMQGGMSDMRHGMHAMGMGMGGGGMGMMGMRIHPGMAQQHNLRSGSSRSSKRDRHSVFPASQLPRVVPARARLLHVSAGHCNYRALQDGLPGLTLARVCVYSRGVPAATGAWTTTLTCSTASSARR